MSGTGRDQYSPHAFGVPFDKDNEPDCEFTKENVQEVIEELCAKLAGSASFGPTWGKGGTAGPGEYLYNEEVESNKSGRFVPFNGTIVKFYVNNRKNIGARTLQLMKRTPCQTGTWTQIGSDFTLSAGTYCNTFTANISVSSGDELAVRVKTGSNDFEDPIVGIIVKGVT